MDRWQAAEEALVGEGAGGALRPGSMRSGKDILRATKPFAVDDRFRSFRHVAVTLALLTGTTVLAATTHGLLIRLALAIVSGLTIVRMFTHYHDYMHGALLRGSLAARVVFTTYGLLALTPPRVWRDTHNYHHAHTAKLVGSHVGSFAMVTPAMWKQMPQKQRLLYRVTRHPLTMVLGYFTIFLFGMCISPLLRAPRKNWQAGASLAAHGALVGLLTYRFGFATCLFAYLLPLGVAMATGSYLFYAQHNFPGVRIQPREAWSYVEAARTSSSYLTMGPVLRFFTGNIGYHHVHHTNPMIPFYRLPDAMAHIPELQSPTTTTLSPRDVVACLRVKLWDPEAGIMVGYPPA